MSPTARTLAILRKQGALAQVVEHWNPFSRTRRDLFEIIDIVAIFNGETYGIQVTSGSNHSARVAKIKASEHLQTLILAGWIIQVRSHAKKKGRWCERIETIIV